MGKNNMGPGGQKVANDNNIELVCENANCIQVAQQALLATFGDTVIGFRFYERSEFL
jgi:hypothetical protein